MASDGLPSCLANTDCCALGRRCDDALAVSHLTALYAVLCGMLHSEAAHTLEGPSMVAEQLVALLAGLSESSGPGPQQHLEELAWQVRTTLGSPVSDNVSASILHGLTSALGPARLFVHCQNVYIGHSECMAILAGCCLRLTVSPLPRGTCGYFVLLRSFGPNARLVSARPRASI